MHDAKLFFGEIVPIIFHCAGEEILQPGHYRIVASLLLWLYPRQEDGQEMTSNHLS